MALFKRDKKKADIKVYSPLKGEIISIEQIPDPVFSQKMVGDGIGIIPINGDVFSPIDGKVVQVFPTNHAVGMVADNGVEILLHLGLDTVELKGEGFRMDIVEGDKVKANEKIGNFDLEFVKGKGKGIITALVFPNIVDLGKNIENIKLGDVEAGDEILTIK